MLGLRTPTGTNHGPPGRPRTARPVTAGTALPFDLPLYSDLVGSGRIVVPALGAVLLGVGAIFQPKAKAADHWSTSPRVVMVLEAQSEESGDPPSTAY